MCRDPNATGVTGHDHLLTESFDLLGDLNVAEAVPGVPCHGKYQVNDVGQGARGPVGGQRLAQPPQRVLLEGLHLALGVREARLSKDVRHLSLEPEEAEQVVEVQFALPLRGQHEPANKALPVVNVLDARLVELLELLHERQQVLSRPRAARRDARGVLAVFDQVAHLHHLLLDQLGELVARDAEAEAARRVPHPLRFEHGHHRVGDVRAVGWHVDPFHMLGDAEFVLVVEGRV
mmetsp:Transcript_90811/g.253619  ORF Transcript_90811/g.253619 Transcript_90811/m.253619 type:complete len:234 (+) Transcript_90811:452-1153(+)